MAGGKIPLPDFSQDLVAAKTVRLVVSMELCKRSQNPSTQDR